MGRRRLPDGPGVDAVVEEHDQGGPPVAADRQGSVPAPRPPHLVGGEVEGVDLGLGQVVAAGDVALVPGPGEPRRRLDQLLLPGPGEDGAEVLAGLVGRAARVGPLVLDGLLVDPVEELADVLAPQLLDRAAAAPPLPLPDGREVLVARPAGQALGADVALRRRLEGRRHPSAPIHEARSPNGESPFEHVGSRSMNRAMAYGTFAKTATRGAEPGDCSGWGELHDDTASRTEAGYLLPIGYPKRPVADCRSDRSAR